MVLAGGTAGTLPDEFGVVAVGGGLDSATSKGGEPGVPAGVGATNGVD